MHRLQLHIDQRFFKAWHASAVQLVAQTIPRLLGSRPLFITVHKAMALVSMQVKGQSAIGQMAGALEILETGERITIRKNCARISRKPEPVADLALPQLRGCLVGVCRRIVNGSVRGTVAIVVDHKSPLLACTVRICEDVLVYRARWLEEVVEQEVVAFGKDPAALQQRRNLTFVALHEPMVGRFVVARALVFHAVLLSEPL